jgi:hypothetical protein
MKALAYLVLLSLAGGCAAWTVKSETSHDAQLARYRSYQWLEPRGIDVDRLADQRLRDQVAAQLAQKGIHPAAPGQAPDFFIGYRLQSGPRVQTVATAVPLYAPGASGATTAAPLPNMTYVYQEQSLVLDFIDASSGRVFWRGYASYVLDRPEPLSTKKAQQAAARMLRKYPAETLATATRPSG